MVLARDMLSSLSDIQSHLLRYLKSIEAEVGERFLMADPYAPEIVCWFMGDRKLLLEALSRTNYLTVFRFNNGRKPERRQGEGIRWFGDGEVQVFTSVSVHERIYLGKWAAYNSMSGVRILFPSIDPVTGTHKVSDHSFLQTELRPAEVGAFQKVRILGEDFDAVPNLAPFIGSNKIPTTVDLVYTWVDGSDPEWLREKRETLSNGSDEPYTPDGDIASRYLSRDELRYSLRSAWMYFRNLGKIYIVTCGQRPPFLRTDSDIIKFIDHRDIFPNQSDLPTFNSHAIEANLHRIAGLSDKYLYLNDDFFFCRPVTSKTFFDEYDRTLYFPSRLAAIPSGPATLADAGVDVAAKNARDLIQKKFGIYIARKFKHAPYAIAKSVIVQMEQEWPAIFKKVSATKVRSVHDYAISGSLYFHFATCIGKATAGEINYDYFDINTPDFIRSISESLYAVGDLKRLDTMCVNDQNVTENTRQNEQFFLRLMQEIYPDPAPFEIGH